MSASCVYILTSDGELYHYGVKGMRWGVRRTREEIDRANNTMANYSVRQTVSGHAATPKNAEPNAVYDHISYDGTIDVRTFYDNNGFKHRDIHTTSHGNPKQHTFGLHGEHVVEYEWNDDGSIKNKSRRELTETERKENSDII